MKNKAGFWMTTITLIILTCWSCKKVMPGPKADDEVLDGPVEGLSDNQSLQHLKGDVAFNDRVFTAETGLGSVFVANSCGSCHAGDGKGHPFTALIRFGQSDSTGNRYLDQGGPQLQNRAMPGFQPETLPAGAPFSKFMPPANTGLGYLELVSDADLIAMSDPHDVNGDGISGVPNWKPLGGYLLAGKNAIARNGQYIHRFGKKASAFSLLHQTVNAYNQDMGITSSYNPYDVYTNNEIDPEITVQEINDVVFYLQTLKAPVQREQENPEVKMGKNVFMDLGCNGCHRETLKTGESPVSALSNKEFHPYTDLLLHDMGAGLDDGYTEGSAKSSEWRTPALWGLGLSPNSQGGRFFLMHDGRAHSIEEAIQLHGGEGSAGKDQFMGLSDADKKALIKFLNSL
ncbi:MAG: di-heme oxidoredictase family protein [Bacteroidota bacterium]